MFPLLAAVLTLKTQVASYHSISADPAYVDSSMESVTAIIFQTLFKAACGGTVEALFKLADFAEKRDLDETQLDQLLEVLHVHFANQAAPREPEKDLLVIQCASRLIAKYCDKESPDLLRLWSDSAWPFLMQAIKPAMVDPPSRTISDDLRNNLLSAFTDCLVKFAYGDLLYMITTKDVIRYLIAIWLEEMRELEAGSDATGLLDQFVEEAERLNKPDVWDFILGPAALFASEIAREATRYIGCSVPNYCRFMSVFSMMTTFWKHSQILHNAFLAENLAPAATNALCILGSALDQDHSSRREVGIVGRALRMLYFTISQSATEGALVQALQAGLFEGLVNGHTRWLPLLQLEDHQDIYYRFFENVFFKGSEIPSVVYALWQRRTFREMAMNEEGAPGWNGDMRMRQAWMRLEDRAKSSLQRHADILPDSFESPQQNEKVRRIPIEIRVIILNSFAQHPESCVCNLCLRAILAGPIQPPLQLIPQAILSCA
ncbi:hypothetical protein OE88DRAFT_526473 [Heliocybe sulcata]|uniref:Uncharacterized protein n=1 Tax=Heliocybe sulcata TaxID=5364 RepID=A0A5C3MTU7_9AGAM|nr:hypothetical protein OE88DRAFT_526473 [Heliocybe sulcata]